MEKKHIWFSAFQLLFCSSLFYYLIGQYDEMRMLFGVLILACGVAIACSVWAVSNYSLKNSVIINAIGIAVYLAFGMYYNEAFTFEIIEEVKEGLSDDPMGIVITSRRVAYGGLDFFLIYAFNALLAYRLIIRLDTTAASFEQPGFSNTHFTVRTGNKIQLVPYNETDYVEASGNYINIFRGNKKYTVRMGMGDFLQQTQDASLVRIHRSFAINSLQIDEIENYQDGFYVRLKNGKTLRGSKQYKSDLYSRLGIS